MEFAELELEAQKRLGDLKSRLGFKAIKLQGKRPSALKAAMIYILARERGFAVFQRDVAEIYGITEVSVHNNIKLLRRLMQDNGVKLE